MNTKQELEIALSSVADLVAESIGGDVDGVMEFDEPTTSSLEQAVELLFRHGYIKRKGRYRYVMTDKTVWGRV